jgi:hypothetical protein
MTSIPGWYPDPSDDRIMRYWDGAQWKGERSLGGTAAVGDTETASEAQTVAPPAPEVVAPRVAPPTVAPPTIPPPAAAPPQAPASAPTTVGSRVQISVTAWLLFGGAAIVALGSLLPWVQVTGLFGATISSSPQGGGPVFLMALAGGVVWLGWPSRLGRVSKGRCIGVTLIVGLLSIFVFSNFGDISNYQQKYPGSGINAGPGLYIYTAGVVAIWVGVVRAWLALRARAVEGGGGVISPSAQT